MRKTGTTTGKAIAALAVIAMIMTACNFINAAPSECIRAAEDAGLPDDVIDQLENPGDLNALERVALQQALKRAGIDDVCEVASEGSQSPSSSSRNGLPTLEGTGAAVQRGESQEAETGRDSGQGQTDQSAAHEGARIPDDEHRRRCRFWALNNMQPVVYGVFSNLNPDTMDDLDRILWRYKLHRNSHLGYCDEDAAPTQEGSLLLPRNPGIYCRDYWAEPLNRGNADLRNAGFEAECRFRLEERITNRYQRLQDWVHNDDDNELVYQTPNQYVRILEWLDLSGNELLDADSPPYRILEIQSQHQYAHWHDWAPTEDGLIDYAREYDETLNLEWLGISPSLRVRRHP